MWFFICVGLLIALVASEVGHRDTRSKHESCHQATVATLEALSNRAKVRALTAAAEEYDSPAGQRWLKLKQRAMQVGNQFDRSVPAEFMLKEAEKYEEGSDV